MEPLPRSAGDLLRSHRTRAGLTQQDLATLAGVSVRALRDLERGRSRHPRARALHALAEALALTDVERAQVQLAAAAGGSDAGTGLYVDVLGPLSVRRGPVPINVGPVKQRLLLGLLALQPGRPVSVDEIVEVLWPSRPPRTHQGLIHSYVARLRSAVEVQRYGTARFIASIRGGYRIDPARADLDVVRFEELVRVARQASAGGDSAAALAAYGGALRCWRGRVLADLGPALQQHPAAVALARLRLAAGLAYADLAVGSGQHDGAIAVLQEFAEIEVLHEGLYARLMLALAGSGQQATALRLYAEVSTRLRDELGIAPGAELTAAHLRILRQDLPGPGAVPVTGQATAPGGRNVPPVVPAQLPPDIPDFTGRRPELDRLTALARTAGGPHPGALPIVIVSGPPGVGKTALAIHWAHRVTGSYVDGQLFVDLRGHSPDPPLRPIDALHHLLLACGVAVGDLPAEPDFAAGLLRSVLAGRRVLVVLDNAASAAQVRPLLPGGGGCLVLVTSRDRLDGLVARHGARRVGLRALNDVESAALLANVLGPERIRAEPAAVADLAGLCGHLPLALRIAAAQLTGGQTTIASFAAGLRDGQRIARLEVAGDELSAGVEAAFERSYAALAGPERRLFRLAGLAPGPDLSVAGVADLGGVSRPEAAATLERLVRAHLMERTGPLRYRFHDLIRCYAVDRGRAEDGAADRDAALLRLVRAYATAATAAARMLYPQLMRLQRAAATPGQTQFADHAAALAWFGDERPNLVAAVRETAARPWPEVAHLAYAVRGYLEHRRHLDDLMAVARAGLAVAAATADGRGAASAWINVAMAYGSRAEFGPARHGFLTALRSARRSGWTDIEAVAHNNLGVMYSQLGRLDAAARHYRAALASYRGTGWDVGQGSCLTNLGSVCYRRGRLAEAVRYQTEAMELADRIDAVGVAAIAREHLGRANLALGRVEAARPHLAAALDRFRQVGHAPGEAAVLQLLAAAHVAAGELARGADLAAAALAVARQVRDGAVAVDVHTTLGELHLRRGDPGAAAQAYQQALHLSGRRGPRFGEVEALIGLARARMALDDPAGGVAAARRALSRARRLGYLVLDGRAGLALAEVYAGCGRTGPAVRHLDRALRRHRRTGDHPSEARALALRNRLRSTVSGAEGA